MAVKHLVDRYKYKDLMPCSETDLAAMGYVHSEGRDAVDSTSEAQDEGGRRKSSKKRGIFVLPP